MKASDRMIEKETRIKTHLIYQGMAARRTWVIRKRKGQGKIKIKKIEQPSVSSSGSMGS